MRSVSITGILVMLAVLLRVPAAGVTHDELRAVVDESTVELTTIGRKSGKPRTVTIWFVYDDRAVYVQSGKGGETEWYRNLRKNPRATLRIADVVVTGEANVVDDADETKRLHGLFLQKYWTARIAGWLGRGFGTGKVVRITPTAPDGAPGRPNGA